MEYDAVAGTGCPYVVNLRTVSAIKVQITFKNPLIREITGTWDCYDPDYVRNSCTPSVDLGGRPGPRLDYWQKSNGSGDFWGLVRGYEDTIWYVPAVATPTFVPALTLGPGSGSPALLQGIE